jgi:hypothetical protein
MTKYKAWGLKEDDFHEPHERIIPERVQKIIDLHHRNHIQYEMTLEDRNEQVFEYRRSLKPSTYTYNLQSIYRVRDPHDKTKEYFFCQKEGTVLNDNDDPERSGSLTYGFAIEHVHELRWNPKTKRKEPFRIRDDPVYFYKWDKKEVQKLLEGSATPCMNTYIGIASRKGFANIPPATDVMIVKNRGDFLNGSFDDLALLGRAGIMSPDMSTLNMIDKAKSRFEEEALKRIAAVASPQPEQLQEKQPK